MANVSVKIGGNWLPLKRSSNNQWPYYNTNGPWQGSFPMPVRITSATGEVVEDNIPNAKGGVGSKQFTEVCFSFIALMQSSLRMLDQITPAVEGSVNSKISVPGAVKNDLIQHAVRFVGVLICASHSLQNSMTEGTV